MRLIQGFIVVLIIVIVGVSIYESVREEVPRENHCLEKELTYYRAVGGILKSDVKTTEQNSDYSIMKCIKWEEEPSLSKALLGQELVE